MVIVSVLEDLFVIDWKKYEDICIKIWKLSIIVSRVIYEVDTKPGIQLIIMHTHKFNVK